MTYEAGSPKHSQRYIGPKNGMETGKVMDEKRWLGGSCHNIVNLFPVLPPKEQGARQRE